MSLVHYYDFKDENGGRLADKSGHASAKAVTENGTGSAITYVDAHQIQTGKPTSYAALPTARWLGHDTAGGGAIDAEASFSIAGWGRRADFSSATVRLVGFAEIAGSGQRDVHLAAQNDRSARWFENTQVGTDISLGSTVGSLSDATWHHFAATVNAAVSGGGAKRHVLYIDGVEVDSSDVDEGLLDYLFERLAIGCRPGNIAGGFWVGDVAQIKVFDHALTPAEVATERDSFELAGGGGESEYVRRLRLGRRPGGRRNYYR